MELKKHPIRNRCGLALTLVLLSGWASNAAAQGTDGSGPVKQGFTIELSLGVGIQTVNPDDDFFESETKVGLAGLNLGIGGFINPSFAILAKWMVTIVYEEIAPGVDYTQISGVFGPAVQFWLLDVLRLEAGIGFSFVAVEVSASSGGVTISGQDDDGGFGLMFGAAWVFWQNQKHGLSVGLDWAPAFFEDGLIHNTGIVFGWQLY